MGSSGYGQMGKLTSFFPSLVEFFIDRGCTPFAAGMLTVAYNLN